MTLRRSGVVGLTALLTSLLFGSFSASAAEGRKIEEVIVTAERQEASVQDTSISITAFTGQMLDDFGIRNQSDLQNLTPATTIQPYDSTIRGVGRNFRNLGGDPGIATYMNGVYSEDLYTATIGSLWDVDRIEILRGPQGTLYGRNAVGGAMNFLYKKPSDEFELGLKTVLGDYGTEDYYGVISGPIIQDKLNYRITGSMRHHDGWIEERGQGSDLDSGDERNISLQFEWLISDNMTFHVRSNRAKVDRTMGGANGGGLIVLSGENSGPGEDGLRNFTADSLGLRAVDPTEVNPLSSAFLNPAQPVLTYTNPTTGADILAQRVRSGVDPGGGSGRVNHARGSTRSPSECVFTDREDIDGSDLCAFTNGQNYEIFNQQGNQAEFSWDITDGITFKYIFGLNALLYERVTDDDNTNSLFDDNQFYVNHEAEYVSHEFQVFWDVGDSLTFTSGVFFYDSTIDQRGDFYSQPGAVQFTDPAFGFDNILATVAPGLIPGDPPLTFLTGLAAPINIESAKNLAVANGIPTGTFVPVAGPWIGDGSLGSVEHGPTTLGTDLHYDTKTEREATAIYTQGVWDINETFTLTAGVRWAEDDIVGQEKLARYAESGAILAAVGLDLGTANILRGALDPATLLPTGAAPLWLNGVPITFGAYRKVERVDRKVTWRVNLDWNLTDDSLIYGNVTTGYRSGGFNLVFFSQTPQYEPEELIAYELGYKAQFLDNSLQFNGSVYLYDYESIHTTTEEACPQPPTAQSLASACAVSDSTTSVEAAPGAEVFGFEFEVLYLATDALTLGGNFSFSDTEYTESFFVVDGADPTTPGGIYNPLNNGDRVRDIKGHELPQVPETKASAYARYNFALGDGGNIDLLGSYSYISDVYFSAFQDDLDLAPAYSRFDLRATWTSADQQWVISGFVNNVLDEIGIRQILRHGGSDGFRRTAQVTEPRLWGVELSYHTN